MVRFRMKGTAGNVMRNEIGGLVGVDNIPLDSLPVPDRLRVYGRGLSGLQNIYYGFRTSTTAANHFGGR